MSLEKSKRLLKQKTLDLLKSEKLLNLQSTASSKQRSPANNG
jgi:hypothetical protein